MPLEFVSTVPQQSASHLHIRVIFQCIGRLSAPESLVTVRNTVIDNSVSSRGGRTIAQEIALIYQTVTSAGQDQRSSSWTACSNADSPLLVVGPSRSHQHGKNDHRASPRALDRYRESGMEVRWQSPAAAGQIRRPHPRVQLPAPTSGSGHAQKTSTAHPTAPSGLTRRRVPVSQARHHRHRLRGVRSLFRPQLRDSWSANSGTLAT